MFLVCKEHLEQALDEFVEEYGESPDIHRLDEIHFRQWRAPEKCQFCDAPPCYLVI